MNDARQADEAAVEVRRFDDFKTRPAFPGEKKDK